ncbi:MAG TPA: hypothetical protein VFK11_03815 [Candidatus Saccharimonadales bacterium]|nr:hypothetical protein [Candidatus Saccharimonadales bacterium]
MNERNGELCRAPMGDAMADEASNRLLAGVPAEAIEVLGEETCLAMATTVEAIGRLENLANTPDPFEKDGPSNISLGAFKPEHAALIANYQSAEQAFAGLSHKQKFRLPTRTARKIPDIHDRVLEMRDYAEPVIREFEDDVAKAGGPEGADRDIDEATELFIELFEKMYSASEELPTRSAVRMVENAYDITIEGYKYRSSHLHRSRMGRHLGRPPKPTTEIIELLQGMLKGFKGELASVNALRKRGSETHGAIVGLIRTEQVKQAVILASDIGAIKGHLAGVARQDGQLERALSVERYITGQAEVVESVFENAGPQISKGRLSATDVEKAKEPALAREIEQSEISRKRALIGGNVMAGISQVKNVLRGGGRLEPAKGQDGDYIKRKAKKLFGLVDGNQQRLFEREESGMIVAIITDRFDDFREVVEKVKMHASNGNLEAFPAERLDAVREISGFDLDKALRKIQAVFEDTDLYTSLEKVLDLKEIEKLGSTLEQALEPQTS